MQQKGSEFPLPTPGRLRRFAAMMYEAVLLFGVVFLASLLFDTLTQSRHALSFRHARQLVLFLAIGAYFILSWRRGQTLPMKTWHIRLVAADGQPLRWSQLLLRYVLVWPLPLAGAALVFGLAHLTGYASTDMFIVFAPFLLFIPTWLDPQKQFLHDRIAGTRLVDTRDRPNMVSHD
ncbi:MAG TPA: RDD family protein [Burkholderiaceae bacterium]|nr:RDD family protein [Burkholderiaceae bacterium]